MILFCIYVNTLQKEILQNDSIKKSQITQHQNILRMQLQIQTFKKNLKQSPKKNINGQLPSFKDIFPPHKVVIPSQALLSQLRQIQLTGKAHYHYLTKLRKKAFKILTEQDYEAQVAIMQIGFHSFKNSLIESKIQKRQKRQFIQKLILSHKHKKFKQEQQKKAVVFYESNVLRKYFTEIVSMIKTRKKSQRLEQYIRKQRQAQILQLLKQITLKKRKKRYQKEQIQNQIDSIYKRQIYKRIFSYWKIFCKLLKLENKLKRQALRNFVGKLIQEKRNTIQIVERFRDLQCQKLKRKILEVFKQTKLQSQCFDWYKYRLQKVYFNKWLQYHSITKNQQQLEQSNQIILKHYLEDKQSKNSSKLLIKYFVFWQSWLQLEKQNKKQTQILKSFAQLKQKQYLQRKYFAILKQNCYYQKSIKFYHKKLKIKTVQGLKKYFITQSTKQQNIHKFIQKRTISKYFKSIQLFSQKEKYKVQNFLLKKLWFKLIFNITAEYIQKIQKAESYYWTSLKFRSLYGLNKNVQVNRKTQYCSFYLNITLPLKRWNKRFRLRNWIYNKELYLTKKIFFEWKLISIRKTLSKKKQPQISSTSQLFVQSRINPKRQAQQQKVIPELNKLKKQSSQITQQQISFFKKMNQPSSDEDDQIQIKIDTLMTKIKTQRVSKKKEPINSNILQTFSNERMLFTNESISGKMNRQVNERVRLPTWSTPGNQYPVSIFSQDFDQ